MLLVSDRMFSGCHAFGAIAPQPRECESRIHTRKMQKKYENK
jgi:hypothetical protein